MPKRTKVKIIEVTFPQSIWIYVVRTDDVLHYRNNDMREKWPLLPGVVDDDPEGMHTCQYKDYPNTHWIILEHGSDMFTALHEVVHCTDAIMIWFGFEDTEFRAYMQEFLLKQIL